MAGISDQAMLKPENRFKYNAGSELQHKEFSDGSGLEMYGTAYRGYDPQTGRFTAIDPEPADMLSPYSYAINNPVYFEDPLGAKAESLGEFLYDALYNKGSSTYQNGGSWSADGSSDDGSGDPMGNGSDYGSQADAFMSGAEDIESSGGGGIGFYAAARYNFYANGGTGAIPDYGIFRADYFRQLQQVTVTANDPMSWAAARANIYEQVQRALNSITAMNTTENVLDASGLTWDATRYGTMGAQRLGNAFGGTSNAIQDIGKLQLTKIGRFGMTAEVAGKALGAAGLLVTGYDMTENGINWSNGTDMVMGGAAFIPGVGWVISGTYFISNIAVEHYTGQSIGDLMGEGYPSVNWNNAATYLY